MGSEIENELPENEAGVLYGERSRFPLPPVMFSVVFPVSLFFRLLRRSLVSSFQE